MIAKQLITDLPSVIDPNNTGSDVLYFMDEDKLSVLPVVNQGNYLGIYITDSDDDSQGLRYYALTRSGWSYDDWWYFQYYKDAIEFFISEVHALNRYPNTSPSPPTGLRIISSS